MGTRLRRSVFAFLQLLVWWLLALLEQRMLRLLAGYLQHRANSMQPVLVCCSRCISATDAE